MSQRLPRIEVHTGGAGFILLWVIDPGEVMGVFSEPGQLGGIVADRARSGGIQALERDRHSKHFLFRKILFEEMIL